MIFNNLDVLRIIDVFMLSLNKNGSNVVGIICHHGWSRNNWSAKNWGDLGTSPPAPPVLTAQTNPSCESKQICVIVHRRYNDSFYSFTQLLTSIWSMVSVNNGYICRFRLYFELNGGWLNVGGFWTELLTVACSYYIYGVLSSLSLAFCLQ